MSSIYSKELYNEFEALRQKLLRVKGSMTEEEYSKLNEKVSELSQEIISLGDDATQWEYMALIKKVVNIEDNILSDKKVQELERNANRQNFINMLNIVEDNMEDIDKVEEFIKEAKPYWDKIKDSYDTLEQAQVAERMTMVLLKFNMAKAISSKELNIADLPQIDNISATHALIDFLSERSSKASGMDKATLELYLGQIIDREKGIINIEEAEILIREEKLWNILFGETKVEFLTEEKVENIPSDNKSEKNEDKKERTYEDELKEMADKYQVPWKKLMTNTGDIALILRDKKGKCKVQKVRQYNHLTKPLSKNQKLRDECVAIVFNNQIKLIDSASFNGFMNLEEVRLPDSLKVIGERAFKESGIKEVKLPIWVQEIRGSAFYKCKRLKNIELNEGLELIEYCAFAFSGIKCIKTPDSLRRIEASAFTNCIDLEVAQFNPGLKYIGNWAIAGTGLKEMEIPKGVKCDEVAYSLDFVKTLDLSTISKLQTVKVIDGERKPIIIYKVEADENGKRKLVAESSEKSRHSNRNAGIDR